MPPPFDRDLVVDAFHKKGIKKLYFFSHLENAFTIADYGLLSLNTIQNCSIPYHSFAEVTVQDRRDARYIETSAGETRNLHDMVPFYFVTKTPTLFSRRQNQSVFVFWSVPIDLIRDPDIEFAFSDGNLASRQTEVFFHQLDVEKIPISVLRAEYWNNHDDGKRRRNSEMLIYGSVPIDYIECVYCNSDTTKELFLDGTRTRSFDGSVTVDSLLYFPT